MLRLGIAQTNNHYDYILNRQAISRAMEIHSKHSVDLVLFAEAVTTGYNCGLFTIDESKLNDTIQVVIDLAKKLKIAVALPTPWPTGNGKFFNSLLLIDEAGKILHRFDKVGFQKGEEKIFTPGELKSRCFSYKGYQIGVLICIEAECGAWDFLKPSSACDLILWPGFYGMHPGETWETANAAEYLKVKLNLKEWKSALIQATCSSSPESQHWPDKNFGGSAVVDRHGKNVFNAKSGAEDMVVIDFKNNEILEAKSISN